MFYKNMRITNNLNKKELSKVSNILNREKCYNERKLCESNILILRSSMCFSLSTLLEAIEVV